MLHSKPNYSNTLVKFGPEFEPNFEPELERLAPFLATGDEEILSPTDRLTLLHIKATQMRRLPEADIVFLLTTATSTVFKDAISSVTILTHLDDPELARLVEVYPKIIPEAQRMVLALFAGIDSEVASRFLFQLLEDTHDDKLAYYLMVCISKSDFPVFAIVFFALPTASTRYRLRLRTLLQMKGFSYAAPFLMALPIIPEREFFEETFGYEELQKVDKGTAR